MGKIKFEGFVNPHTIAESVLKWGNLPNENQTLYLNRKITKSKIFDDDRKVEIIIRVVEK